MVHHKLLTTAIHRLQEETSSRTVIGRMLSYHKRTTGDCCGKSKVFPCSVIGARREFEFRSMSKSQNETEMWKSFLIIISFYPRIGSQNMNAFAQF